VGNVIFNIILGSHRLQVEIFYVSNQVTRFKVKMKEKHFILEENLLNKSDKWKLREYSDTVDLNKLMENLPRIIEDIEGYFKPKDKFQGKKSW
jgi:hypothetical protein